MNTMNRIMATWTLAGGILSGWGVAAGQATQPGGAPAAGGAASHARVQPVGMGEAQWTGGFWGERFDLCRDVMIPNLWRVMQLPDNAANFNDLRMAAGLVPKGKPGGTKWNDGDCYKWIESAAWLYALNRDETLARQMDEAIEVIAKAQQEDGYISTWVQLTGTPRWADLHNHELYNMGHLLTAACVHRRATGKDNFLKIAVKVGDYLDKTFSPRPPELAHFGFNPSNIMGAADLYLATGDRRYLRLAGVFVSMRGSVKGGSDQNQDGVPLRREQEAVGHAVTAGYLWCGAADVCAHTGEKVLREALERIWRDVTERKMYVTGGVGALHYGESQRTSIKKFPRDSVHEAFGAAYQLPNRTAYNETCANIANAMWNRRMLALTGEGKYADVMERVLYNSMLSAMSLDGKSFFYTNVLRRCGPDVSLLNQDSRLRWPDTTPASPVRCFCCPPSVTRTLAQLHEWAYGLSDGAIWVHLYGTGCLETKLPDGLPVRLTQQTDYPWDGRVRLTVSGPPGKAFAVRLRLPGWAEGAAIRLNGQPQQPSAEDGYAMLNRAWSAADVIELDLPMPPRLVEAHPLVEEARGQVAVMRGPVVYCLESPDLPQGVTVGEVRLPADVKLEPRWDKDLLGGVVVLEGKGVALPAGDWTERLYRSSSAPAAREIPLRLIPYYAWCNRGESEMTVWIPRS